MTSRAQLYRFDFTLAASEISYQEVTKILDLYSKKWCFQLEKGEKTGWSHYQGRVSLKVKIRLQSLIKNKIFGDKKAPHWSVTMKETSGFDYVLKDDTRIDGPWKDTDRAKYIPRQFRGKMDTLRPFQKHIIDTAYDFDDRIINIIICPEGAIGKSVVASLCELYRRGIDLPICNDAEKLIQSCCNICMKKNIRNPSPIFIDLPRSFNQDSMYGIFTAIEQIKKGKLYDMRYNYCEWWIDSPQIWVFTNNSELDFKMLSKDRWKLWAVDGKTFELTRFKALACNNPTELVKPLTPINLSVGSTGSLYVSDWDESTIPDVSSD